MTDKKYEDARNALIPHAERHANLTIGETPDGLDRVEWVGAWNVAYLGEMTRLWALEAKRGKHNE